MKGKLQKSILCFFMFVLMLSFSPVPKSMVAKAADTQLNKKTIILRTGQSYLLKVKGGKVKTWKSSDRKIASVSKTGKVTARKKGIVKVSAVLTNKKQLTCTVVVRLKEADSILLPDGRVQSLDNVRFLGDAFADDGTRVPLGTPGSKYVFHGINTGLKTGIEVCLTNIPGNAPDYQWSISDTNVLQISRKVSERSVIVKTCGYGTATLSVTVSYKGLSKTVSQQIVVSPPDAK